MAQELSFGYGERRILDGVSFEVPRGKVTALMGASGGGKTTVLRLISGQYRAQSGQMLFDGQDVGQLEQPALYLARRRMGMLFQFGALFTDLSVFDNVAFPLREHTDLGEELIRDVVLMKLQAVGLRGARDLMPSEVSGGMARRVALARAMALCPTDPAQGFARYEAVRKERTARVVEGSAANTKRFHNPALAHAQGAAEYVEREWNEARVKERYEWLFKYDIDAVAL
jgi:ABC-type branched-subunit amino acid transport system ATPase component